MTDMGLQVINVIPIDENLLKKTNKPYISWFLVPAVESNIILTTLLQQSINALCIY